MFVLEPVVYAETIYQDDGTVVYMTFILAPKISGWTLYVGTLPSDMVSRSFVFQARKYLECSECYRPYKLTFMICYHFLLQ